MENTNKTKNIYFEIIFIIFFSIYALYCIYHKGSLVRGIGWKTKKDYPISYIITILFAFILIFVTTLKYII